MKESRIIDLGNKLTLSSIGKVQRQLEDAVIYRVPVVFKADKVEIADSASLQLIHSFRTLLKVRGIETSWHYPSEQLIELSLLLGFSEKLEIPLARPKQSYFMKNTSDAGISDSNYIPL